VRSGVHSAAPAWPGRGDHGQPRTAALRKEGTGFDLAIALTVLAASGQVPARAARRARVHRRARPRRAVGPVGGDDRGGGGRARSRSRARAVRRRIRARGGARRDRGVGVRHIAEAVGYLRARTRSSRPLPERGRRAPSSRRPTSPTCAAGTGRRALELAAAGRTTSCSPARPGRARRCSRGDFPPSCRRSPRTRRSR
jgi:magnesium chelatase family protein